MGGAAVSHRELTTVLTTTMTTVGLPDTSTYTTIRTRIVPGRTTGLCLRIKRSIGSSAAPDRSIRRGTRHHWRSHRCSSMALADQSWYIESAFGTKRSWHIEKRSDRALVGETPSIHHALQVRLRGHAQRPMGAQLIGGIGVTRVSQVRATPMADPRGWDLDEIHRRLSRSTTQLKDLNPCRRWPSPPRTPLAPL